MRKGIMTGLAVLALALPASAQVAEPETLRITATNVTAEETGREAPGDVLLPGDIVEYRLLFTNTTDGPVDNVVFNDPIPQGLTYVLGTATADRQDVVVDYSADGGATWAAEPQIEVEVGGETVLRPAPVTTYTHIRWTVQGEVAPGATVTARFRAEARPTPGEEGGS